MSRPEPPQKPPDVLAGIGEFTCQLCKGRLFRMMLDTRRFKQKAGQYIKMTSVEPLKLIYIECEACGEQYDPAKMGVVL